VREIEEIADYALRELCVDLVEDDDKEHFAGDIAVARYTSARVLEQEAAIAK